MREILLLLDFHFSGEDTQVLGDCDFSEDAKSMCPVELGLELITNIILYLVLIEKSELNNSAL